MITAIAMLMNHGWVVRSAVPPHSPLGSGPRHAAPIALMSNATTDGQNSTNHRRRQLLTDVGAFAGGAFAAEVVVRANRFVNQRLEDDNLATTMELMQ